jgi:hypothetical protein
VIWLISGCMEDGNYLRKITPFSRKTQENC